MSAGGYSEIVAAIKFDEQAAALVRAAAELARASGRPLRLVHAVRIGPAMGAVASSFRDFAGMPPDLEAELATAPADRVLEDAKVQLQWLAKEHATAAPEAPLANASIVIGDFPDAIIEFAAARGAALLVAGAAVQRPGLLKAKLRHTYRMMARAAMPVLVMPDARTRLEVGRRPLRILVADDLTAASLRALRAAEAFVALVRAPADVLHLHVEPAAGAFPGASDEVIDVWPGLSVHDRLVNDHHERLEQRLVTRAKTLAELVRGLGGTYRTGLWHGNVATEIARAAQVHAADVSVFGAHQVLRRQPLGLGQMPYGAMLGVDGAVLVAPR